MTANDPNDELEITSSWTPKPQPVQAGPIAPPPITPVTLRTSVIPLVLLIGVNGLLFAIGQLPELPHPPWLVGVLGQLASLASGTLVRIGAAGTAVVAPGDTLIVVALLGAALLTWVVRSRFRSNLLLVTGAAAVVAVPLALAMVLRFVSAAQPRSVATGLVLGVLAAAAAAVTPVLVSASGAGIAQRSSARLWWLLLLFAVVYIAPLAVGRAAQHAGLATVTGSSLQEYCAGIALGAIAWCLLQVPPPIRVDRLGTAFVVLAIALGPVLDIAAGRY